MATLAITRKVANTDATASAMNTNYDEIEAVVNNLEDDNIADDAITAAKLNSDVVRADYGLKQHTDGSIYVDVSDTNPGLELTDGGLRVKSYGLIQRVANGLEWGRTADVMLSGHADTPDGFTDVTATYTGKMIRINATAFSTGGSDTLSGTTGSHTLTSDEMPAHTHTYTKSPGASSTGSDAGGDGTQTLDTANTSSTGGGSGHTHTLTGVACVSAYMTLKMFQKN